jgi:hypothetical protein
MERGCNNSDSVHACLILDAFHPGIRFQYRPATVIPYLGHHEDDVGYYITFFMVFGQWIPFDDSYFAAVIEFAVLEDTFPETDGSMKTASILCYASDN